MLPDKNSAQTAWKNCIPPVLVFLAALGAWQILMSQHVLPPSMFPTPRQVAKGFGEEMHSGRLYTDIIASLWRVVVGFTLSVLVALPAGIALGQSSLLRSAFMPALNFLRCLSPLAWIGFAILWFGVGDNSAIFLIFLSLVFPIALSVSTAVLSIPPLYYRVAKELGLSQWEKLNQVILPAIMPGLITTLRVAMGVGWLVVVAAEMTAGNSGLGFAIYDDRNALRQDLLVVHMIVIGIIGLLLDRMLAGIASMPSVQWGYQQTNL